MADTLAEFLAWPFVWRALIVGVLIALCSALLGVTLVLRRLSFMGDSLSHVAFGAMAICGAIGMISGGMWLSLLLTASAAILLLGCGTKGRGDAQLAMLSVTSMAVGYLMMNLFPASSNISGDICTTLFGAVSLLTLSFLDAFFCVILSIAVIIFHLFTYHRNFDIAFDEEFSRVSGVNAKLFNFLSAIVVASVIVVSMKLVGALLVSALLVFPGVSALKISKSFRSVTLTAAAFSIVFALTGILAAVIAGTPVGATIVAVEAIGYFSALIFSKLARRTALILTAILPIGAALLFTLSIPANDKINIDKSKPTIVASIFPIYDWVNEIVGENADRFNIILLQNSGSDLHSFSASAKDMRLAANSDLFILVGGVSDEAWENKLLADKKNKNRKVVKLLEYLEKIPVAFNCEGEGICREHEHEHKHGHDSETSDEHIWLSPRDVIRCTLTIADEIAALDAENSEVYCQNAQEFCAKLAEIDKAYAQLAEENKDRFLVFADRFPFQRLAIQYGFNYIAAFNGCSAESEASFETVKRLAEAIEIHRPEQLLVLETSDAKLARSLCEMFANEYLSFCKVDSLQSFRDKSTSRHVTLEALEENLEAFSSALGEL
ncbi:MAG: zinc ABC transporter substrate-binding protein [Kiritimatiellae bacterium]|nr:zinc ABC transporter substrate-binding protein [Kiritimatiellia bacterium]